MMGVQAYVRNCIRMHDHDSTKGRTILRCDDYGNILEIDKRDGPVIKADHFNKVPFRNLNFNQIRWVRGSDGLIRHLPRIQRAVRQAFNSMCQGTGADHLRWLMNRVQSEVLDRSEFQDCKMILTVHDSIVFEVPNDKVDAISHHVYDIMRSRPRWSDIDMKVEIEVGQRYGEMESWMPPIEKRKCGKPSGCLLGGFGRFFGHSSYYWEQDILDTSVSFSLAISMKKETMMFRKTCSG